MISFVICLLDHYDVLDNTILRISDELYAICFHGLCCYMHVERNKLTLSRCSYYVTFCPMPKKIKQGTVSFNYSNILENILNYLYTRISTFSFVSHNLAIEINLFDV